jgi:signal transduction histidine kinase
MTEPAVALAASAERVGRAHRTAGSSAGRALILGQHGLFVALMVVATARALLGAAPSAAVAPLAGATAAWYAAGIPLGRRAAAGAAPAWTGYAWFAGLVALWVGLVVASAEYSWVAFPLYLLALHLLPRPWGWAAVAALAVVVIAVQLTSGTAPGGPGQVLGPVIGALVAVGAVVTYERVVAEADERARLLAELVAAQRDLLAANEDLAAAQRQAGALAERARLAHDIHDTLAQGFSSIVLLSRAGQGRDGTSGAGATPDVLAQIEATAVENLAEARRVVAALAPADLDQAPLAAALARLLDRFGAQTGVRTSLSVDGSPLDVPTGHDVVLLRIAQGALANVRQHAGAQRVGISLSYAPDATTLDVVDDGRGFDPDATLRDAVGRPRGPARLRADGSGFGLAAMRARLADVRGELVIESEPGDGTAVSATIPLPAPARAIAQATAAMARAPVPSPEADGKADA